MASDALAPCIPSSYQWTWSSLRVTPNKCCLNEWLIWNMPQSQWSESENQTVLQGPVVWFAWTQRHGTWSRDPLVVLSTKTLVRRCVVFPNNLRPLCQRRHLQNVYNLQVGVFHSMSKVWQQHICREMKFNCCYHSEILLAATTGRHSAAASVTVDTRSASFSTGFRNGVTFLRVVYDSQSRTHQRRYRHVVVMLCNMWLAESSRAPALWRHDHNVGDQNMVVLPIVGVDSPWLLTEENLPPKYNVNEMKSM